MGSSTTQYWRFVSVVMPTVLNTFSDTIGVNAGVSSTVTSHLSPALRSLPNTSLWSYSDSTSTDFLFVSTRASTTPTISSSTSGRYAPSSVTSHSSPAVRTAPLRSVKFTRALMRSDSSGFTSFAVTFVTNDTFSFGMYVAGPLNSHSSPALRSAPLAWQSSSARRRRAVFFMTTVSFLIDWSDLPSLPTSTSPGYRGNGSVHAVPSFTRTSSCPKRMAASLKSVCTIFPPARVTGFLMRQYVCGGRETNLSTDVVTFSWSFSVKVVGPTTHREMFSLLSSTWMYCSRVSLKTLVIVALPSGLLCHQ
eukprot:Rhum_TRINITY_DN4287_c0_g2::Rhum_TRINITY_DN4287_c0_g2_i1::g.13763::m.13763